MTSHFRNLSVLILLVLASVGWSYAQSVPADLTLLPMETVVKDKLAEARTFRVTLEGAVWQTSRKDDNPTETPAADKLKPLHLVLIKDGDTWREFVGIQAPGLNRGSHSGKLANTKAKASQLEVEANIGHDRWVKGDAQARYTLSLSEKDGNVEGTYQGTFQGVKLNGKITGDVNGPGWHKSANITDEGIAVSFDMGNNRRNWNNARWLPFDFIRAADLSDYDGLVVTITTDNPRTDAWVDFGIQEFDGSWYYVRDAVSLSQKVNKAYIRFSDLRHAEFLFNGAGTWAGVDGNFDENFNFNPDKTGKLAFGVVNAHGVGKVEFTINDVQFATDKKLRASLESPVKIEVTGKTLSINDRNVVPHGIFGFHAAGGSAEQVADLDVGSLRPLRAMGYGGSFVLKPQPELGVTLTVSGNYDRKQQLPQPETNNWKGAMIKSGQGVGYQAKPYGKAVAIEFWNEPYLELGKFLKNKINKQVKAPDDVKEGDPVIYQGKPMESFVWRKTGDGKWEAHDPTRFTYWSGRQIALYYTEAFKVFAEEAKKIAPDVQMVGGFGFRWNEDDWASWHIMHKPLVDGAIDLMDGICDHRYQGYPDGIIASYEVLQAYTVAKYGKRLDFYNTEVNDLWDAPARGNANASNQFGGKFKSRRRMIYNLRDIIYCVKESSDKAKARAIHALWKGNPNASTPWGKAGIDEGEYLALKFLKPLRGQLVESTSSDAGVWSVSSIHPDTNELTLIVFNDTAHTRSIDMQVKVPDGTEVESGSFVQLKHDETGAVKLTEPVDMRATGTVIAGQGLSLEPSHAMRFTLKLKGKVNEKPQLRRQQVFAKAPSEDVDPILFEVKPSTAVTLPIALPEESASATRVWLRLVVERLGEQEGRVSVAGKTIALPRALTPINCPAIVEIPLEPGDLDKLDKLTFTANEGSNGYLLCMASVMLEYD